MRKSEVRESKSEEGVRTEEEADQVDRQVMEEDGTTTRKATEEETTEDMESAARESATGVATVATEVVNGETAAGAVTGTAGGKELDCRSKARIPNY